MFGILARLFPRRPRETRGYGRLFTPSFTVAALLLLLILCSTAFAHWLAPHDPYAQDWAASWAKPSAAHWLGADQNGRDIFSRLLYGGRTALHGGVGVVAISAVLGIPLGLLSGYLGKKTDAVIMRSCDVLLSFPSLLLAMVLVAGLRAGLYSSVLALGIVYIPMLTRLTRSLVLVEKNKVYSMACRALGYSDTRIMYRHILPNCLSTILVQLTLDVAYAILDLSALSFLGLGVGEPTADWGAMLGVGRNYLVQNPYLALAPGAMIVLTVVSLNLCSDGLHQYLDKNQTALPSFSAVERREAKRRAKRQAAAR